MIDRFLLAVHLLVIVVITCVICWMVIGDDDGAVGGDNIYIVN